VLEACDGISGKDEAFEAGENVRLTFYVGSGSDAMVVSDVVNVTNGPHFVKLVLREDGTQLYVEHDAVGAVSVRPPKGGSRKTGFA
jgi:hypothetical protein